MKKITLNIPDSKYSFFLELVKNLGIEKVKNQSSKNSDENSEKKILKKNISSLRGKLKLSDQQYKEFQKEVKDSRKEWSRDI